MAGFLAAGFAATAGAAFFATAGAAFFATTGAAFAATGLRAAGTAFATFFAGAFFSDFIVLTPCSVPGAFIFPSLQPTSGLKIARTLSPPLRIASPILHFFCFITPSRKAHSTAISPPVNEIGRSRSKPFYPIFFYSTPQKIHFLKPLFPFSEYPNPESSPPSIPNTTHESGRPSRPPPLLKLQMQKPRSHATIHPS